jgi:AcrR family transcriptional regulator
MVGTKKQDLIDTATDLFNKYGYQAVGIDRIIEESRVAKMTMYRHFPSKDDLITEVLMQRMEKIEESMSKAVAKKAAGMERLHELFIWHDRWFKTSDFMGCMFITALSEFRSVDGGVAHAVATQKRRMNELVRNIVASLVQSSDATRLARQIVILLDGAIISAQAGNRKTAASDAWECARGLIAN